MEDELIDKLLKEAQAKANVLGADENKDEIIKRHLEFILGAMKRNKDISIHSSDSHGEEYIINPEERFAKVGTPHLSYYYVINKKLTDVKELRIE